MKKTELAWAAGLFEGEGCVTISHAKGGWLQPRVKLNMIDEDVVRRFHRIIGIGTIVRVAAREPGYQVQWQWGVGNWEQVQVVLALLFPYLGERRRQRITEVLSEVSAYKTNL